MADKPFTNREIKTMFQGQADQIKEVHADVKSVLEQATKTNGRVGKLENWQSFMRGGLAILALMVVPVLIYLITHWK